MLEILAILFLASANGRKAISRGRKPGGFYGATIALWFGSELFGIFVLGALISPNEFLGAYAVGLGLAIIGGITSRIIASNCKPGDYLPYQDAPLAGAHALEAPVNVTVLREASMVGAAIKYSLTLNGVAIGELRNGDSLTAQTSLVHNRLIVRDSMGNPFPVLHFAVQSGVPAQIVVQSSRFKPERSVNCFVMADAQVAALAAAAPAAQMGYSEPQAYPPPAAHMGYSEPQAYPPPAAQMGYGGPQAYPPPSMAVPAAPVALPDVRRAIAVTAAALLLFLIIALIPAAPIKHFGLELLSPLLALSWGFGFYIAYRDCLKCRVIGSVALVLLAFFHALSVGVCILFMQTGVHNLGGAFAHAAFGNTVGLSLLNALLLAAIAVVGGIWLREKLKLRSLALIGGAITLIVSVIADRWVFMVPNPGQAVHTMTGDVVFAAFVVLAALLARMMTELKDQKIRISTGARVWCIIVAASMSISLIANIASGFRPAGFQSILLIPVAVGMIMLCANRRVGFTLALLGGGASVMYALTRIIPFNNQSLTYIGFAIGGAVNLTITWLAIASAWRRNEALEAAYAAPQPQYAASQPQYAAPQPQYAAPQPQYGVGSGGVSRVRDGLSAVFPVFQLLGALVGAALFFAGIADVFGTSRFNWQPFVFGVLIGGVLAAFEISVAVRYFKQRGRTGKALQIVGLCIGALSSVGILVGFVASL